MPSCTSGHHLLVKYHPWGGSQPMTRTNWQLQSWCCCVHLNTDTLHHSVHHYYFCYVIQFILSMCSLQDLLASYSLVVVTAEATYSTLVTPINKCHTTTNYEWRWAWARLRQIYTFHVLISRSISYSYSLVRFSRGYLLYSCGAHVHALHFRTI